METQFSMVPVAAFKDRRLTYRQLVVLGAICSFRQASSNLSVCAGRDEITERCGLHPSVISAATTDLEDLGWLQKSGRGGRSVKTTYLIAIPETVAESETVTHNATVSNHVTVAESETVTEPVSKTVAEYATRQYRTEFTERGARSPKGSRLPLDWSLPDEYRHWSTGNLGWSATQAGEIAERFADYWHSATGKNATKADWFATWRNWCRRENVQVAKPAACKPSMAKPGDTRMRHGMTETFNEVAGWVPA